MPLVGLPGGTLGKTDHSIESFDENHQLRHEAHQARHACGAQHPEHPRHSKHGGAPGDASSEAAGKNRAPELGMGRLLTQKAAPTLETHETWANSSLNSVFSPTSLF